MVSDTEKEFVKQTLGFDPLCGWEWYIRHEHDLDGWEPTFELEAPGVHFKMTIKDKGAIKKIGEVVRGV